MTDISAPIFVFGEHPPLTAHDAHTRLQPQVHPQGALALTGPSVTAEPGHLPVRGDLAHIRLAGRYFVPHYAVPMPHRVRTVGAELRQTIKADAEVLGELAAGTRFDVLDIAGNWAWGQQGEDGLVGYVSLDALEAQA